MCLNQAPDQDERPDHDPILNLKNAVGIIVLVLAIYLGSLLQEDASTSLDISTDEQAKALAAKLVVKDGNTVTIDLSEYPTALLPQQQDDFRSLVRDYYRQNCTNCPTIKSISINRQSMKITFVPQDDTQPGKAPP